MMGKPVKRCLYVQQNLDQSVLPVFVSGNYIVNQSQILDSVQDGLLFLFDLPKPLGMVFRLRPKVSQLLEEAAFIKPE